MATLRCINMMACDFTTLPSMVLPCLEVLRISRCQDLYELPEFPASLLPKLTVLELHELSSIFALPESLGRFTVLTRLNIASCPLSFILKSLQSLIALRELTINCVNLYFSNDPITYPLLTEVLSACAMLSNKAYCLPALCSLTKLCLRGARSRSTTQCDNDLVVIGCALRAWPLPLLDPVLMELPVLSLRTPQNKSDDVGNLTFATVFDFKLFWSKLGLPTQAASWDNEIMCQCFCTSDTVTFWRAGQCLDDQNREDFVYT